MRKTLWEISRLIGGRLEGDPQTIVTGLAGIDDATPNDLTFLDSAKFAARLASTKAGAIVVRDSLGLKPSIPCVHVPNADLAFTKLAMIVQQERDAAPARLHPTAIIHHKAKLGKNVSIGPWTIVEENVEIGDQTVIGPLCFLGFGARVGANCRLWSHVCLRDRCSVGDRCVLHPGVVIGADGFGFIRVGDHYEKIPQIGTVVIEDDVEIGANSTIDRARLDKTIVRKGTKIDNLVMVGHSVQIGRHCVLAGQAGIAGSSSIGDNCMVGGQVGIADHLTLGHGIILTAHAGISKSFSAPGAYGGYPARPHMEHLRSQAALYKLPELIEQVAALKEKIKELEAKLK